MTDRAAWFWFLWPPIEDTQSTLCWDLTVWFCPLCSLSEGFHYYFKRNTRLCFFENQRAQKRWGEAWGVRVPCSACPLTVPALSLGKGWNLCLQLDQSDFSFLEFKGINERWTRASCGHKPPADMVVAASVTSAFRKLRKEDPWAQASLSYTVRARLKNKDFSTQHSIYLGLSASVLCCWSRYDACILYSHTQAGVQSATFSVILYLILMCATAHTHTQCSMK